MGTRERAPLVMRLLLIERTYLRLTGAIVMKGKPRVLFTAALARISHGWFIEGRILLLGVD